MTVKPQWRPFVWVAFVYGFLALVIGLLFEPLARPRWHGQTKEQARFYDVKGDLNRANRALHAITVRDSILPLLPTQPAVVVEMPTRVASAMLSELPKRVQREAGTDRPRALVGLYLIPYYFDARDNLNLETRNATVMLMGTVRTPHCIVAAPLRPAPLDTVMVNFERSAADNAILGPCRLWARYGAPGPNIGTWLERGGYDFAKRTIVSFYRRNDFKTRRLFGASPLMFYGSLAGDACFAGKTTACARGVLDSVPTVWRSDIDGVYALGNRRELFVSGQEVMLHDAETEFGTERFARFWTSSADVSAAFHDAFGVELGIWVRDWFGKKYGARKAGPAVPVASLALSLLTIGALAGAAIFVGQRRHVG